MIRRYETDPIDRDERLGEAIEAFLALAEEGPPPDPEVFAQRYPELGEDLRAALEGLALVRGLVGDPTGAGHRFEAGHRIAGYRIVRELGRGGMGIVYEAVHVDLDRPVALKVLATQAAPDSVGRRRFLNEARTAAGLHHTHIVPVFDVGQVGGLCYYAMQRIEGNGLDHVIRALRRNRSTAAGSGGGSVHTVRSTAPSASPPQTDGASRFTGSTGTWVAGGHPPEGLAGVRPGGERGGRDDEAPPYEPPRGSAYFRWVAEVGRRAAEALAHAHHRGVIHRDIKPSNILVDSRGAIWVADFGLARRLDDPGLTQSDSRLGTPRYMSPEQADRGEIDARTDVYSLGASLYELLTLRPPFEGRTAADLTRQICLRDPVPPRQADRRIQRDLETIVLKSMAKRPADRYATAAELAEDLARFLRYEPVRARRIGPVGRLWRVAQRHPGITAVSTIAAATVLATAIIGYVRVLHERDLAVHARTETQSALRKQYLSEATTVRLSPIPNRRDKGLKLLAQAAALGPESALRPKLRDEAAEFLALRDVEPRKPDLRTGKIQGLVFNQEGNRLVTLSEDLSELHLWDVARRQHLATHSLRTGSPAPPAGLGGPPRGFWPAFGRIAAIGPYVAAVWHDGRGIRLVDAATGDSFNLPTPGHEIVSLLTSTESNRILTIEHAARDVRRPRPTEKARPPAAPDDFWINLWDPEVREAPIATLALPAPASEAQRRGLRPPPLVAISPDGELVATAWPQETFVSFWTKDGQSRDGIETQVHLTALAFGPDEILATAGDGAIQLLQLDFHSPAAGPIPTHLTGLNTQQGNVYSLRFSPDGTMLAAALFNSSGIQLWDLATDALVATLPSKDPVNDLAFSPTGRLLAVGGRADAVSIWGILDPIALVRLPEFKGRPRSLAFGPDDLLAIVAIGTQTRELRFWRPGHCPAVRRSSDQVTPSAVAFDLRQRFLAIDYDAIYRFPAPGPRAWTPKGGLPPDREQFDLPTLPRRPGPRGISGPGGFMNNVTIARPTTGRVIVGSRGSELWIWHPEASDGPRRLELAGIADAASYGDIGRGRPQWREIAVSTDGNRLYLQSTAEDFSAWSIAGNRARRLAWPNLGKVSSTALSRDGETLALGDGSGNVALVDTRTGLVRARLTPPAGETEERVSSLAFSPKGDELAVGTSDHVRLWSVVGDPQPLVRLPGHQGAVIALAYDSEGRHLATAGADRMVAVWDLDRVHRELKPLGLGW
jgi:eukaryotic-like serine/threonine-protein kinase